MANLSGKIALVTGASRGVGRGIAQELGAAGALVYVTGRSVGAAPATENLPGDVHDTAALVTNRAASASPSPATIPKTPTSTPYSPASAANKLAWTS